jgi:hypothetical protein
VVDKRSGAFYSKSKLKEAKKQMDNYRQLTRDEGLTFQKLLNKQIWQERERAKGGEPAKRGEPLSPSIIKKITKVKKLHKDTGKKYKYVNKYVDTITNDLQQDMLKHKSRDEFHSKYELKFDPDIYDIRYDTNYDDYRPLDTNEKTVLQTALDEQIHHMI